MSFIILNWIQFFMNDAISQTGIARIQLSSGEQLVALVHTNLHEGNYYIPFIGN